MMKKVDFNFYDISTYKDEIYGVSIIWIMLFHAIAILGLDYGKSFPVLSIADFLIGFGNMGVEVFLMCSGICLYFSFRKNSDIGDFLKKRLVRLMLPVIVIESIYWVYLCFFSSEGGGWTDFLERLFLLKFWITGDQQVYFVSMILLFYILYPYIYSILFSERRREGGELSRCVMLIAVCVLFTYLIMCGERDFYDRTEIALTRLPVFIFGCYLGKKVYEKKPIDRRWFWIALIAAILQFIVLGAGFPEGICMRYFYLIGGTSITFLIPMILKVLSWERLNRFLAFFGRISLNLYLSHIVVIHLYERTAFYEGKRILDYFVILIISTVLAAAAEVIIKAVRRRIMQ